MPSAIRTDSKNNRTTGLAVPGLFNNQPASVAQQVHDGDTLHVIPKGNIGVRLLGIDTPEVSFMFPGPAGQFVSLNDARWNEFLSTALDPRWGQFSVPLSADLTSWLQPRLQGEPGTVHRAHADRATDALRAMISADMHIMGQDLSSFGYYMAFGFEVMDGYGRFLCTINRDQPLRNVPTPRPPTYNMRMLQSGLAFPYFIWPNINPLQRPDSVAKAVIPPGKAKELADSDTELLMARHAVQQARQNHLGVFEMMSPCLLEPFELRFLSRREMPSRYVIDLSSDTDRMLPPERYFEVPNSEDRLWVSSIYVPLFQQHGWKIA